MAAHSKKIIRVITLDVEESESVANSKSICDATADDDTPTAEDIDLPLEIANLAVEKEIFLRACLQMLDKREALLRSGVRTSSESPSTDIIKSGTLKKSAPSSLNHVWRVKYIELRHGQFSYCEDISSSGKPAKKKIITLNVATCICRPSRLYENCAFELTGADGGAAGNRLWLAASTEERNAWIEAILSAMIGSAGDFVSGDGATTSASERDDMSSSHKQLVPAIDASEALSSGSLYGKDIEAFQLIQQQIKTASSPEAYRSSLAAYANMHLVTIPVSFVKDAAHVSMFSKGVQDMGMSSARSVSSNSSRSKAPKTVSTQSSQAWKDLHRDVIIVNDELVSGVQGPESMVGALVRHILQHVKMLKLALQQRNVILEPDDLNESHVLHCAREVLLACNRTQSGGDTYYCIESLLCNRDFAVLTPNASEAEPMRITVSLVENKSRRREEEASVGATDTRRQLNISTRDEDDSPHHISMTPASPQSECAVMYPLSVSPSTAASGGRDDSSKSRTSPCITPQQLHPPRRTDENVVDEDTDSEEATHMLHRANSLFSHHSDIPGAEALHSTLYLNSLKEKQAAMLERRIKSGEHDIDEEEADEESETTSSSDMIASRPISLSGIPDPVMQLAAPTHRRASSNPNPLFVDISDPNLLVTHDASGNIVRDSPPPNYYELTEKNVIEGTTLQWTDEGTVAMSELTMETAGINNLNFISFRKRAKSLLRTGQATKPPMSPAPMSAMDDDSVRMNKERRPSKFLKMGFSTPRKKDSSSATSTSNTTGKSKFPKIPGTGKLKKALRSAGKQLMMPKKLLISEEEDDGSSSAAVSMCVKIQVTARSQYRLCNADPQNETDDNWAVVTGDFQQFFFLKPYCNGHPAVSDRLVSMRLEHVLQAEEIR